MDGQKGKSAPTLWVNIANYVTPLGQLFKAVKLTLFNQRYFATHGYIIFLIVTRREWLYLNFVVSIAMG